VLRPPDDLEGDISKVHLLDRPGRKTVDRYELGGHGILVLGSRPGDPPVADAKPFCNLLDRPLELPVRLGEPADQVRAVIYFPEGEGDLIDDEILRLRAEPSPDPPGLGCVVAHPQFLFQGVGCGHHSSERSPVIRSRSSVRAGPRPSAVTVPGGISVIPASWMIDTGMPASSAIVLSS